MTDNATENTALLEGVSIPVSPGLIQSRTSKRVISQSVPSSGEWNSFEGSLHLPSSLSSTIKSDSGSQSVLVYQADHGSEEDLLDVFQGRAGNKSAESSLNDVCDWSSFYLGILTSGGRVVHQSSYDMGVPGECKDII